MAKRKYQRTGMPERFKLKKIYCDEREHWTIKSFSDKYKKNQLKRRSFRTKLAGIGAIFFGIMLCISGVGIGVGIGFIVTGTAMAGGKAVYPVAKRGWQKASRSRSWSSFKSDMKEKMPPAYHAQFDAIKGAWEYQMRHEEILSDLREEAIKLQKDYKYETNDPNSELCKKLEEFREEIHEKLGDALDSQLPRASQRDPLSELKDIDRVLAEHFWATRYLEGKLCDKMMQVYDSWETKKEFPKLDPKVTDPYGNVICQVTPEYSEKDPACLQFANQSDNKPFPIMAMELLNKSDEYKNATSTQKDDPNATANYFHKLCDNFDKGLENPVFVRQHNNLNSVCLVRFPTNSTLLQFDKKENRKPNPRYGYR